MTGTSSLQPQETRATTKKQLSISCGRRKPLSVIYSLSWKPQATCAPNGSCCCCVTGELNGYLCGSALWSLLMTSRWSSSIFKALLSTREALVMSAPVIGANEISQSPKKAEKTEACRSGASVRGRTPRSAARCDTPASTSGRDSWFQKCGKSLRVFFFFFTHHSPTAELSALYNWISRERGKGGGGEGRQ